MYVERRFLCTRIDGHAAVESLAVCILVSVRVRRGKIQGLSPRDFFTVSKIATCRCVFCSHVSLATLISEKKTRAYAVVVVALPPPVFAHGDGGYGARGSAAVSRCCVFSLVRFCRCSFFPSGSNRRSKTPKPVACFPYFSISYMPPSILLVSAHYYSWTCKAAEHACSK